MSVTTIVLGLLGLLGVILVIRIVGRIGDRIDEWREDRALRAIIDENVRRIEERRSTQSRLDTKS